VARANPPKKKKPIGPERPVRPEPAEIGPGKGRLLALIGTMVVLLSVLIGRWVCQAWVSPLPELPFLTLDGVDPEVAEVLTQQRSAVEQAPRSAEAWGRLAMLLHAHQFTDQALVCYGAAEKLDPTNPLWPYFQGYLLLEGARPDQAVSRLERAAALAPDNWPIPRFRLADLLLDLGRSDDAERIYRTQLATKTDNEFVRDYAQFGLAKVFFARQKLSDALPFLQAAADDPYIRKRSFALRIAIDERLDKRAESDSKRAAFAMLPDDLAWPDGTEQVDELRVGWRGRISRAKSLLNADQPAEALKLLVETVGKYPDNDQVWVALGVAKENMKDFTGAEEAYRKGIALAPDRAAHRIEVGKFLQARQRYQEAAAVFRDAIQLSPFEAAIHFQLGVCLQSLGDYAGAAEAYRQALRYNPNLNAARQNLERLTTRN
jgi:tetratricopeptide (TPR) repeat protein